MAHRVKTQTCCWLGSSYWSLMLPPPLTDSGSDCDIDPGDHCRPCSGADDPRRDGDGPGRPAEDHPAAGADRRHLTADPDATSPQPRPAGRDVRRRRVPGATSPSAPAGPQGSTPPGRHQGQNPCQAQRGEQLSFVQHNPPPPPLLPQSNNTCVQHNIEAVLSIMTLVVPILFFFFTQSTRSSSLCCFQIWNVS